MGQQIRYWNKFDDDDTYEISSWLVALNTPGRYHGFDNAGFAANMTLTLDHALTGYQRITKAKAFASKAGVFITSQGAVVYDTNTYDLAISPTGAGENRRDLVVATHEYIDVDDGQQATVTVIEGSPSAGDPVRPALTSPETQIVIGELYLPENTSALNGAGVVWMPEPAPTYSGSGRYALRDKNNRYTAQNQEYVLSYNTPSDTLEHENGFFKKSDLSNTILLGSNYGGDSINLTLDLVSGTNNTLVV